MSSIKIEKALTDAQIRHLQYLEDAPTVITYGCCRRDGMRLASIKCLAKRKLAWEILLGAKTYGYVITDAGREALKTGTYSA